MARVNLTKVKKFQSFKQELDFEHSFDCIFTQMLAMHCAHLNTVHCYIGLHSSYMYAVEQ